MSDPLHIYCQLVGGWGICLNNKQEGAQRRDIGPLILAPTEIYTTTENITLCSWDHDQASHFVLGITTEDHTLFLGSHVHHTLAVLVPEDTLFHSLPRSTTSADMLMRMHTSFAGCSAGGGDPLGQADPGHWGTPSSTPYLCMAKSGVANFRAMHCGDSFGPS